MKLCAVWLSLFLIFLPGCDLPTVFDNTSANQENRGELVILPLLEVEITGGIAGLSQQLTLFADGKAIFLDAQTGARWVTQLPQAELLQLVALFNKNEYFSLDDRYVDPNVADAFYYTITFRDGEQVKTVTTDGLVAPETLKRILEGVMTLVERVRTNGLDLQIRLSRSEMVVGDSVVLTLLVTNVADTALTLHFSSGQIFDFYARSVTGDLLWNWAHDKAFTQILRELVLQAGESRSYRVTWNGVGNDGLHAIGHVRVGAELVSVPGGRPAETPLRITAGKQRQGKGTLSWFR